MIKRLITSLTFILFGQYLTAQTFDFNSVTTGGSTTGSSKCVDVVDGGNIFSVGNFKGSVDFNSDPLQTQNIYSVTNSMFIQCTDEGNPQQFLPLIWVKAIIAGGSSIINPTAICLGNENTTTGLIDIYVVGSFEGTIDFNPDPLSTVNLTSNGSTDAFILKMTSDGAFIYAKQIGGSGADKITSVSYNGSLNLLGTFSGNVDLNPNTGSQNASANGTNTDIFIEKLSNTGNFTWAKVISGPQEETPLSMYSEAGEVVITGGYQGTVDFNPAGAVYSLTSVSSSSFIAKYDNLGNFIWVTGQVNATTTSGVDITAITDICKFNNEYYVCGYCWELIIFSTASGTQVGFTPNANNANFIAKFNNNGQAIWLKAIDNPSGTPQSFSDPFSIAVSGGIYIAGGHFGQTDFDPGPGLAQLPSGQDGSYFAKYDLNGNFNFVRLLEKTDWGAQPRLTASFFHPLWTRVIICGGTFNGTQDFNFSAGTNNRTSVGTGDFYLTLMDIIP